MKRTPCSDCPFRRDSVEGWLGESSFDPHALTLSPIWHDRIRQPCHTKVDWEQPDCKETAQTAPLCQGALIMMKNAAKVPRGADIARYVKETDRDPDAVFTTPQEFMEHHKAPYHEN